MWNPDGKVLLAGFNGTTSLAALHFAGRPPSLGEGDLAYYAYVGSLSLPMISCVWHNACYSSPVSMLQHHSSIW
jgi:hypothetical protein